MGLLFVIRNFKAYKHWRKVKNGRKTHDLKRGTGYYITIGLLGHNPVGRVRELELTNGQIGLYELLSYETFRDPRDMIKESTWHFHGYVGLKAIKDCTFSEFVNLYC